MGNETGFDKFLQIPYIFTPFYNPVSIPLDESSEFWLNTVPKLRKSEYRPEKSE